VSKRLALIAYDFQANQLVLVIFALRQDRPVLCAHEEPLVADVVNSIFALELVKGDQHALIVRAQATDMHFLVSIPKKKTGAGLQAFREIGHDTHEHLAPQAVRPLQQANR
jgi:hypothetical protein